MLRFMLRYHQTALRLPQSGALVLGREPGCDVCIDDPVASRRHARLTVREGSVWIEDLGSRNGVSVNGVRLKAGPRQLQPWDWFQIGENEFCLRVEGQNPAPRRAADPKTLSSHDLEKTWCAEVPTDFDREPATRTHAPALKPLEALRESGRRSLAEPTRPPAQRFQNALNLVQLLCEAEAPKEAQQLLGEAIEQLHHPSVIGTLQPSLASRARIYIARWFPESVRPAAWKARMEILRQAVAAPLEQT